MEQNSLWRTFSVVSATLASATLIILSLVLSLSPGEISESHISFMTFRSAFTATLFLISTIGGFIMAAVSEEKIFGISEFIKDSFLFKLLTILILSVFSGGLFLLLRLAQDFGMFFT